MHVQSLQCQLNYGLCPRDHIKNTVYPHFDFVCLEKDNSCTRSYCYFMYYVHDTLVHEYVQQLCVWRHLSRKNSVRRSVWYNSELGLFFTSQNYWVYYLFFITSFVAKINMTFFFSFQINKVFLRFYKFVEVCIFPQSVTEKDHIKTRSR